MKNFVLISSPLQALVFWLIFNTNHRFQNEDFLIFIEDGYKLPKHPKLEYKYIASTRGNNFDAIRDNLNLINNEVTHDVILWISDLLWPMNNACYTMLLKEENLYKVIFFDEGMVMYWQEKLNIYRYFKEIFKFTLYKFKNSIEFIYPSKMLFYNNKKNGAVYAIHPNLLKYNKDIQKIIIRDIDIDTFRNSLDKDINFSHPVFNSNSSSALFLSQPFYRVTDIDNFKGVIIKISTYLKSNGYNNLYVKMHPSETISDFKDLYADAGFQIVFESSALPMESYLNLFNHNSTLLSFNSSVLLNARAFGYKGIVQSVGLDWVSNLYPAQKSSLMEQKSLFELSGVIMKNIKNL